MFWNKKIEEKTKRWIRAVETVEIFFQEFVITYESGDEFSHELTEYESIVEFSSGGEFHKSVRVVKLELLRGSLVSAISNNLSFYTFDSNTDTPTVISLKNISKIVFEEPDPMGTMETEHWTLEE